MTVINQNTINDNNRKGNIVHSKLSNYYSRNGLEEINLCIDPFIKLIFFHNPMTCLHSK